MGEAFDRSSPNCLSNSCLRESRSPDQTAEKKDWWVMNRRAFDKFESERDIKNLHEIERERLQECCVGFILIFGLCVLCLFSKKKRKYQIKENVLLVLRSRFVFSLFLFKVHLDLNSCDFWLLIMFLIFLVKINKLIFLI